MLWRVDQGLTALAAELLVTGHALGLDESLIAELKSSQSELLTWIERQMPPKLARQRRPELTARARRTKYSERAERRWRRPSLFADDYRIYCERTHKIMGADQYPHAASAGTLSPFTGLCPAARSIHCRATVPR